MSITPDQVRRDTWVACCYCPYAVPLDRAVLAEGARWAHAACIKRRVPAATGEQS